MIPVEIPYCPVVDDVVGQEVRGPGRGEGEAVGLELAPLDQEAHAGGALAQQSLVESGIKPRVLFRYF